MRRSSSFPRSNSSAHVSNLVKVMRSAQTRGAAALPVAKILEITRAKEKARALLEATAASFVSGGLAEQPITNLTRRAWKSMGLDDSTAAVEDRVARRAASLGLFIALDCHPAPTLPTACMPCDEDDNDGMPALVPKRHFTCSICLNLRWSDAGSALSLPCCGVQYCSECWAGVSENALSTSPPTALKLVRCPTPYCQQPTGVVKIAAHAKALHAGLERLAVDPSATVTARRSLRTLCALHALPRAAPCPACRTVTQVPPRGSSDVVCTAANCATRFCVVHGDAHPGETCAAYVRRLEHADPEQRALARRMHTRRCPACMRRIVKNGGCDNMTCLCGNTFRWSSVPLEVPCTCLNLRTPNGAFAPWGGKPCTGAAPMAHVKLAAWRASVTVAALPCLAVALPALGLAAVAPALWRSCCAKTRRSFGVSLARHARLCSRGHQPGSFTYNFYVYGSGRNLPLRDI